MPANLDKTFNPAFAYSDGRFPYGRATPAAIINNCRNALLARPGGETYWGAVPSGVTNRGHIQAIYDKTGGLFDEHPEYFAVINGKRTGLGNHLCSTNPVVKQLLVKATSEKFEQGYEVVALGQEDGYIRCECDKCESQDDYRWSRQGAWEDFQRSTLKDTPCVACGECVVRCPMEILHLGNLPENKPYAHGTDAGTGKTIDMPIHEVLDIPKMNERSVEDRG